MMVNKYYCGSHIERWRDRFMETQNTDDYLVIYNGIVKTERTAGEVTFVLISWGGVRLSPFGTSAINWPIVPALDDK
jgi:hypothetical protein